MTAGNWIGIVGGLALFLYGIKLMGSSIEHLAGPKLKKILEKLTSNRFLALLVGIGVTAVIQSSNAVTAMTVDFVNAGLMELTNASGIILGANIGTTITAFLIALKVSTIAPIIAFIGVAAIVFFKNKKINNAGGIIAGLGILFIGMDLMKINMEPLQNEAWFTKIIASLGHNILLGVLVGLIFTSIVQSVSASVGVLLAMAMAGVVTSLGQVVYVMLGMNIGCCIAAVVAAIGGTKDGKRTALIHVILNVFNCVLFIILWNLLPLEEWFSLIPSVRWQIAVFDMVQKVITVIIMLPLLPLVEKLTRIIIPGENEPEQQMLMHIRATDLSTISVGIAQAQAETLRMYDLAKTNLQLACAGLKDKKTGCDMELISQNEETIDYLNKAITEYLVKITSFATNDSDANAIDQMYHVVCDYERIGDHADNIAGYVQYCNENGYNFSSSAHEELRMLIKKVLEFLNEAQDFYLGKSKVDIKTLEDTEESIDEVVDELQEAHIRRLEKGKCTADMGVLYVEILTDFERVADHALNIAQAGLKSSAKYAAKQLKAQEQ